MARHEAIAMLTCKRLCLVAALLILGAATASAGQIDDPRTACAMYKAKTKQWKVDQLREQTINPKSEYQNLQAIKDAMTSVLQFLGYTPKQLREMREWDINGRLWTAYFFKDNQRIPRSISPYQMEQERGLMGKEDQAIAFCDGLGINVRALP